MNLLASMSLTPQTTPEVAPLAPASTPDLLMALSFFNEMQDCAAVDDGSQVKDAETADGTDAALAADTTVVKSPEPEMNDLAFMPAFFMPSMPVRPLPPEVTPALVPLAAAPVAEAMPVAPALTAAVSVPAVEMAAVAINPDQADEPDLPVQRTFELAILPETKTQATLVTPLKLEASQPSTWPRHLESALKERLDVQLGNGVDHAVIKLSPPMLGALEISIKHEAGALSVQLHASNSEVTRQLQSITEHLRNDLSLKEYTSVAVEVRNTSTDKDGSSKQQSASQDEVGQGLAELDEENTEFGLMLARI
ncbi:MAG: flagellar hook-length control protein FliK [Iodobacter sp.]